VDKSRVRAEKNKMSLGNYLAEQILIEDTNITKVIAIYPGRFQPMGKHHAQVYKQLSSKFDEVWVATSGKVQIPKSPFSFAEKKKIIKSHGISKVMQVKSPYKAEEILKKYDPKTTAAVFIVGKKDAGRLKGKFFQDWKGKAEIGYKDGAYLIHAPHISLKVSGYGEMSGTTIRKALGDTTIDTKEKTKLFKGIFGHTKNYDLIVNKLEKLNEIIQEFCKSPQFNNILSEISNAQPGSNDADDGPRYFYGTQKAYKTDNKNLAEKMGMAVIDYISGQEEFFQHQTKFPDGPTGAVSYFPTGVPGTLAGTNYLSDKIGRDAYDRWSRWSKYLAQSAGYEFIDYLGAGTTIKSTKNEPKKQDADILSIQKVLKKQKKSNKKINVSKIPKLKVNKSETNESIADWLTNQILLVEGGAYGHMSHPFDDKGLTFGDFKNIIDLGLRGNLDLEKAATEKTDGQNLFITWNKELKAARNTGDIKRGGVSSQAIAKKFAGRGNIEKAFNYAMNDLSKAIGSINDKQREKIFDGGNNWVNMEIMYPASSNVITYDAPHLQFHNVLQYKDGKAIGSVSDGARILAGMIKQVDANVQKNFSVIGPKILTINPHQDYSAKKPYFNGKLNKLMKKFSMKDSSTFAEYHQAYWEDFVVKKVGSVDNTIKIGLVKRWAFFDKSFRLNKKTIADEKVLDIVIKIDKQKHEAQVKKNMLPFEKLFFELGAEVLKNAEGFLAANPDKAVQNVRKQVAKAISDVRKGGDLKKLNKLTQQLNKINSIGGFKTIVPSEGIVFIYKGNTYKLTGAFAPVNQITGMMTF
tara:strand:- start:1677 stop:4094 length:2418 start_codon:yes stop_codon:yes gene_type:complete